MVTARPKNAVTLSQKNSPKQGERLLCQCGFKDGDSTILSEKSQTGRPVVGQTLDTWDFLLAV
jgi:hypothetical protein